MSRSWAWYFANFVSLPIIAALVWLVAIWTGFAPNLSTLAATLK